MELEERVNHFLKQPKKNSMYGLVNKAVHGLILNNYGEETWTKIKNQAGVDEDYFISMHSYDDSSTYNLVAAASEVLGISAYDVLVSFGKYWVEFTGEQGYSNLLSMGGDNLTDFLKNLDVLHVRVGMTYSDLKPPSFICKELSEDTLCLEYHTHREGLAPLVIGLLEGLAKKFEEEVEIEHTGTRETLGFDVFTIKHTPLTINNIA